MWNDIGNGRPVRATSLVSGSIPMWNDIGNGPAIATH